MERGSKQPEFKLRRALDSRRRRALHAACSRPCVLCFVPTGHIEREREEKAAGAKMQQLSRRAADIKRLLPARPAPLQMRRALSKFSIFTWAVGTFLFKFRWRAAVGPATRRRLNRKREFDQGERASDVAAATRHVNPERLSFLIIFANNSAHVPKAFMEIY